MNSLEKATNFWTDFLEKIGRAWWIEMITQAPNCTYYFGPFMSPKTALFAQSGYIEDLEREASQIIAINIKRCQPQELTIFEDEEII
jgi:Domain of unknown function (DUF1816)